MVVVAAVVVLPAQWWSRGEPWTPSHASPALLDAFLALLCVSVSVLVLVPDTYMCLCGVGGWWWPGLPRGGGAAVLRRGQGAHGKVSIRTWHIGSIAQAIHGI